MARLWTTNDSSWGLKVAGLKQQAVLRCACREESSDICPLPLDMPGRVAQAQCMRESRKHRATHEAPLRVSMMIIHNLHVCRVQIDTTSFYLRVCFVTLALPTFSMRHSSV